MRKGVIVCVDDERVVLNGLQSQLNRDFGSTHSIELAESGEEALLLIKELLNDGNEILIVISDQLMPGLKGHELLKDIHHITPSTYTVLLTGQSDLDAVTDAVNHANLYRYISKPWEGKDLIMTVKEAIKGYYQDKQLQEQNKLLERHNNELEKLVEERTQELTKEKRKSDELLLNILPEETAAELKLNGVATPHHYKQVTVLFSDFQSFTKSASQISPQVLIQTLNECFSAFDDIIERNNLEKIKTIGDAYMCAGGLPIENDTNAENSVSAAIELCHWIKNWNNKRLEKGLDAWEIRVGVHTGELIAGVVGKKKFAYDVWGDTVNLASRMESNGEVGKVNISTSTYELVKDKFSCNYRGKIPVKGKEVTDMYFVETINFPQLQKFILSKLRNELPRNLFYHSVYHTEDVFRATIQIAKQESIDSKSLLLLKTAVLFHDLGFINVTTGHEALACDIAKKILPDYGYTSNDIEKITGMIMATKIPQSPKNKLEEIICDADLDYLGRDDYETISKNLFKEMDQNIKMDEKQWLKLQIDFLEQHQYFTSTSIENRSQKKQKRLLLLKKELEKYN